MEQPAFVGRLNTNMEWIILLQAFIAGWIACQIYINLKIRGVLKRVARENNMTLEELQDKILSDVHGQEHVIRVPNLFTESTDNSIMLYNKDTGRFMCQGKSIEELAENLYKFDKIKFALVKHDDQQFWFVEGKIKNDLKELG